MAVAATLALERPLTISMSTLRSLVRGLFAATVIVSPVVFSEPAPTDLGMAALFVLLPFVGILKVSRTLIILLAFFLVESAGAYFASGFSNDMQRAAVHTSVSLFMYISAFVTAAFVRADPARHSRLILNAYLVASLIASAVAIAGYFDVVPALSESLTRYGRATGTFKDPNVFGPFLIPGILYALDRALSSRPARALMWLAPVAPIGFALLISFSRGAWINCVLALALYAYVSFVSAPLNRTRLKLVGLLAGATFGGLLTLALAEAIPSVGNLLAERASLSQTYDQGPEGRFGGHVKAERLIAEHPLGIGAFTFSDVYHHEDVHDVYLNMMLNAGWIGGLAYMGGLALTLLLGLNHLLKAGPERQIFLVAFAALAGNVFEGQIIDTDHWRHIYLMMGLVWGLMLAHQPALRPQLATRAMQRLPRRRGFAT